MYTFLLFVIVCNHFVKEIEDFLDDLTLQYDGLKTELVNTLAIPALNCKDNAIIQTIAKEMQITIGDFCVGCEAGVFYITFRR